VAVSNVELRVGATQAITALKNVNTQAQKFNQTVNGTNSKLKDANKNLPILGKGFFGAGASAKTAAAGFRTAGAALQSALLPILGITTAIAALGKAFGVLATQDFATAKVKTLGVDVDTLKPKLASLSNELSGQVSSLDLLSASYDVASAGFGEVAELSDVLKASQQGATGGFSDLATVADATTSVLNAYGLSSDQAAKLVDGFIQTQNDGKIVVDQYAQQIGRLAPIAAGAGVGIDELNAAISTVTATGVPVESTFAGLRQVIASIQKPTSEAAKAAKELGVDFSATALSTKGLGGVLEELVAKGGASEETLAKFFGSVEARTAILPLLNDQLVSFNKNLENQANAQDTAAKAAFTASNTIQGQLTRLGTAFTNLVSDGSEFGVIIREVFKVAAVTVEALGAAFKLVLAPVRAIFAAVTEVGKAIAEAIGIDATNFVFDLEQSWIAVKEGVTAFSDSVIKLGTDVGKIIGKMVGFIVTQFKKVVDFVNRNPVLKFIFGRAKLPNLNVKSVEELKDKVEETAVASNKIVESNLTTGKILDQNTSKATTFSTAIINAKNKADELKQKFMEIGESIENGVVQNLTDAAMGTKTLGEAAISVLNDLKRKLIEVAIQQAVSGLGNFLGNALVGLITSGGKSGNLPSSQALGKAASLQTGIPMKLPEGSFNITPKARGGPVSAGGSYLVGERGPELLQMGSRGGNIIPNNAIGGGNTTNNMITVNVDASGTSVQGNGSEADQLGGLIATIVQATIIDEQRAGGLLNR
jgi:TP901 family phage tail tape measure protein